MRWALLLLASTGCLKAVAYHCADDHGCINDGLQGTCEAQGFCSFPDSNCPGGQRFGDLAGSLSNQCVGGLVDSGIPIDAPRPDAPIDAFVPDARECFGSGGYQLCFAMMPPTGTVMLSGTLDTTSDTRCVAMPQAWIDAGQPDACMVLAHDLSVTGNLTVTGSRPLVLVGETVTIGAVVDVASHRGMATAPGGNATQCTAAATTPVNAANGAGGGAGGSFMSKGGNGGRGQDAGSTGGNAAAADAAVPTVLRGGCPGELGGTGTQAAGALGAGGGAIYIASSRLSLPFAGVINVSGAAATGGGTFSGGSGAGSGGMIVISTFQLLTGGGKLMANGGGGASGGNSGSAGANGSDPSTASPTTVAAGGSGGGGSNGGAGFAGSTLAANGSGAQNNKAGGGGGGGGGYIQVNMNLPGITSSPAFAVVP